MYPTSPFLLRRVLLGVVVGLAVLAAGFFGWSRYRVGQYHHRESAVLTAYRGEYRSCVAGGAGTAGCATQVYAACLADPFWRTDEPFTSGWGFGGFGTSGGTEAEVRCRATTAAPSSPAG